MKPTSLSTGPRGSAFPTNKAAGANVWGAAPAGAVSPWGPPARALPAALWLAFPGLALASLLLLGSAGDAGAQQSEALDAEEVVAVEYDASSGTLLKALPHALYRSDDGGGRWTAIPLPSAEESGRIASVALAEGRKENMLYLAGPGFGVLRSQDGGENWSPLNEGLPSRDVVTFAAHADLPDTLYVVLAEQGVYRSEDGGRTWQLMDMGPEKGIRELIHSDMEGSMQTGWLFAATPEGVQRAMDCFCLWRDAGGLTGEVTAVTYDPREPAELHAAVGEELFYSSDGGETWKRSALFEEDVTALTMTADGALYAGTEGGGLSRSLNGGMEWEEVGG